ncbi:MAG TPA: hypothetical protein VFQ45_18215 [Longimicrobium sp.]|nr:hypothetical protein [Longimicrobium sp.]
MSSNSVTLTSPLISNVTYVNGSLVITEGESASPPPNISKNGSTWTLTLEADRQGSESVASSFVNATGGELHEYAPDGGGGTPEKLNFFYQATVTFQVGAAALPVNVFLAQGHYSTTNNWWIGGSSVVNVDDTPLLIVVGNNAIKAILKISGGTSSFNFDTP